MPLWSVRSPSGFPDTCPDTEGHHRGPPPKSRERPGSDIIEFQTERGRHEELLGREDLMAELDALLLGGCGPYLCRQTFL